jgi:hypothetical protein
VPAASRIILALSIAVLLLWQTTGGATAQMVTADLLLACDRAAARAERQWNLPAGLLAAIGTVESGRIDASGLHRRAWPWSINAEGWSFAATSKTDAISTVQALQARGIRRIDVGCFQVDLFSHPRAFASLNEAFDPEANARAASDILLLARFGATAWEPAISAYHSASLLRGGSYLRQVMAAWPAARTRLAVLDMSPADLSGYVVLLSPAAALVRVVTPADTPPTTAPGLPRVILPSDGADAPDQCDGWLAARSGADRTAAAFARAAVMRTSLGTRHGTVDRTSEPFYMGSFSALPQHQTERT